MVFIIKNGFAEKINIKDIFTKEEPMTGRLWYKSNNKENNEEKEESLGKVNMTLLSSSGSLFILTATFLLWLNINRHDK